MDNERHGDGWWVTTFVIGMVALILGVVAIAIASGNTDTSSAAAAVAATGGETEFDVTLADISVTPMMIEVPAGQPITLHVTNTGTLDHDFKVLGETGTTMLKKGQSADVVIGPFTSDTEVWCTVPGHKEAGMKMAVHVLGGTSSGTTGSAATTPGSQSATIDAAAMPATDWQGRDPVLPAKAAGTVHEIAMSATEDLIEVAPGVTQLMWTFDGQVPGPILHGKVGDTFRITLTNDGTMGHSIDFHASKVAWNDEMRTILPGESLVYEFEAQFAGAYMYHCGTAPALHHIGNGMYGAIIVDPPGLAPVDEEFVLVQSELYLGPEGQPGDLTKMMNEEWDAVVFNGYHSQYKFAPIHVEAGKRYRVWVINDGPNENSAFHIVGTVFDTVYKEGAYTLQPDDTHGGSQVLDLQPAQGGFVEFTFAEDGLYPFVTHKFANVGKGAIGFFAVGDVDTTALTGH
ncbi:MAG: multicopper oxidase domain-containing protein [Actinomycetota bacterium]|nr:multicopper oxidase domain-containing protein [Actinomycetota bacterium]